MTGPQTLIVGGFAVNDVKGMRRRRRALTERIPHILTAHPTVEKTSVHMGKNGIVKSHQRYLNRTWCLAAALYHLSEEGLRDSADC